MPYELLLVIASWFCHKHWMLGFVQYIEYVSVCYTWCVSWCLMNVCPWAMSQNHECYTAISLEFDMIWFALECWLINQWNIEYDPYLRQNLRPSCLWKITTKYSNLSTGSKKEFEYQSFAMTKFSLYRYVCNDFQTSFRHPNLPARFHESHVTSSIIMQMGIQRFLFIYNPGI